MFLVNSRRPQLNAAIGTPSQDITGLICLVPSVKLARCLSILNQPTSVSLNTINYHRLTCIDNVRYAKCYKRASRILCYRVVPTRSIAIVASIHAQTID